MADGAAWPRHVEIFEVSPRDGLQAEEHLLSVEQRAELVVRLARAGLKDIEAGSFVRADRIPQLQNTDQVIALARKRLKGFDARLWAFVPNKVGLEHAIASKVDGAGFFVASSDTFCRKNVNRSQQELLTELGPLLKEARRAKVRTRVYVSTIIHCPYEGAIKPSATHRLVAQLLKLGADEVSLGDTTGHGTPLSIRKIVAPLVAKFGPSKLALHLHDTRGTALANALEGLRHGVRRFDSSVGGTGGCPYAPGASGNLSTEDLLFLLQGMGWAKEIPLTKVIAVGGFVQELLAHRMPSKVLQAALATAGGVKSK